MVFTGYAKVRGKECFSERILKKGSHCATFFGNLQHLKHHLSCRWAPPVPHAKQRGSKTIANRAETATRGQEQETNELVSAFQHVGDQHQVPYA